MSMQKKRIAVFIILLLCLQRSPALAAEGEFSAENVKAQLYSQFQSFFNKGMEAHNKGDFGLSKANIAMAQRLLFMIRQMDPGYKDVIGLTYLTRGYSYHTNGREILKSAKPSEADPSAQKGPLAAYYNLTYAQLYYDYSKPLLKEGRYEKILRENIASNNQGIAAADKLLSKANPKKLKSFKEMVGLEAKILVNYDSIQDKFIFNDFISPKRVIEENRAFAKHLKKLNSPDAEGFVVLSDAFDILCQLHTYRYKDAQWLKSNKRKVEKDTALYSRTLKTAERKFSTKGLKDYCQGLIALAGAFEDQFQELSDAQQKLVDRYGYPDSFFIAIGDEGRFEIWNYFKKKKDYAFFDGFLLETKKSIKIQKDFEALNLRPEEFKKGMTEAELEKRLGKPTTTFKLKPPLGEGVKVYDYLNLVRVGTKDGVLMYIRTLPYTAEKREKK